MSGGYLKDNGVWDNFGDAEGCAVKDCMDPVRNGFALCYRHLDAADDTEKYRVRVITPKEA